MHSSHILFHIIKRFGFISLALVALSLTALAQQPGGTGKVMAKVDAGGTGGGGGAPSKVTFNLYRIEPICCEPCKATQRPCSDCCPKTGAFLKSQTITGTGRPEKLEFKDVPPGTYLVINEVDGRRAGYERVIEVREGEKTDLGDLAVDNGTPRDDKKNGNDKAQITERKPNVPGATKPEQ